MKKISFVRVVNQDRNEKTTLFRELEPTDNQATDHIGITFFNDKSVDIYHSLRNGEYFRTVKTLSNQTDITRALAQAGYEVIER